MKDQLFLMQPGFHEGTAGPFYCGDSVPVEGLLGFFPALRQAVDVHYLAFPRPRLDLVALLGEAHQSIPVLVLAGPPAGDEVTFGVKTAAGRRFIDAEAQIRAYLSQRHGVATAK